MILVVDVETTTHNKGHPFDPRNICVSYATFTVSNGVCSRAFRYFTDPDFIEFLTVELQSCSVLIGFNVKFDLHWLSNLGIDIPQHVEIWDCQIAQHLIEGQLEPYLSLDKCLDKYGLPSKKSSVVHELWEAGVQTTDIPVHQLEEYNLGDIDSTYLLYEHQRAVMGEKQQTLTFLEGKDLLTLMSAERAGIKFDVQAARSEITKLQAEVVGLESSLGSWLPDGVPDGCFNWDSGDHLSCILYGGSLEFRYVSEKTTYKSGAKAGQEKNVWTTVIVSFPPLFKPMDGSELKKTKEKTDPKTVRLYSTDQTILAQLKSTSKAKLKLLADLKDRSKKIKIAEMLESILKLFEEKHWEDNLIHGQFNQTVAVTGRLSSSTPNLQNTPPEVDKFLVSRYE